MEIVAETLDKPGKMGMVSVVCNNTHAVDMPIVTFNVAMEDPCPDALPVGVKDTDLNGTPGQVVCVMLIVLYYCPLLFV